MESRLSHGSRGHLLPHFVSLVRGSANCPMHLYLSGSMTLQGAVNCVYKFAGALFLFFSDGSNRNLLKWLGTSHDSLSRNCQSCTHGQGLAGLQFGYISQFGDGAPVLLAKVAISTVGRLWKEIEKLHSYPILSLATALVPPSDYVSLKISSLPLKNPAEELGGTMQSCADDCRVCKGLSLSNISLSKDTVEPNTGVKFPAVLDNHLFGGDTTEVLVGTGYRSMRIMKVKSLNVYAFGLYVHPDSVCKKLGPKYASIPVGELKNSYDFYGDLLREDICMTVRLVVNFNGLKINTVKNAFEQSLRARLQKMNPNTDYHCISAFGSFFNRDIPLPAGTAINFSRTADGQFITEIGGKTIGAVHSRDLCRAFFDMYVGDLPVSAQTKDDIAENVAGLIRRC